MRRAVTAAQNQTSLTNEILEEAFEKIRMGEAKESPDKETLMRIARHEAGHCLIAWVNGNPPVQITIVGRGSTGGFMEREIDERRLLYTKSELEKRIRESMGGRAAEMIYYGKEEGLSTGVSSDLKNATNMALRMVGEFGMDEAFGQVVLVTKPDGALASKMMERAQRIVKEQLDMAIQVLSENRAHLDTLVEKLLEKNRLTKEELEAILPDMSKAE